MMDHFPFYLTLIIAIVLLVVLADKIKVAYPVVLVVAGLLIAADRFLEKPQEEMRFISREGYSIVETGNTMRLERPGHEPLIVTWPRLNQLHGSDQFRYAADSTVTWFFF